MSGWKIVLGVFVPFLAANNLAPSTPLLDVSESGCPIVISGSVDASAEMDGSLYAFKATVAAKNTSEKSILFHAVQIDVVGAMKREGHDTRMLDFFFTDTQFAPDTFQTWEARFGPLGEPHGKQNQHMKATVKTTFVQFVDGSTWGIADQYVLATLKQRSLTLAKLDSLTKISQATGDEQFLSALNERSQLPVINRLQQLRHDGSTAQSLMDQITAMLHAAALHKNAQLLLLSPLINPSLSRSDSTDESTTHEGQFLLVITEVHSDRAATSTDCVIVNSDYRFHLEQRRQDATNHADNTSVFESQLSSSEIDELLGLLDDTEIRNLPSFISPPFPIDTSRFETIIVKIPRGDWIQRTGYFQRLGGPASDPTLPTMRDNVMQESQKIPAKLSALTDWFHGLEHRRLNPIVTDPTQCAMTSMSSH